MTTNNRSVSARKNRRITLPPARWQLLLLAILVISLGSQALAQTAPAGTSTNPQPYFYPAPPAGFDPLTASGADLATYGFPARPAETSPVYAGWARMVTAAKIRVAGPIVSAAFATHHPATNVAQSMTPALGGYYTYPSENWSGMTLVSQSGYFMANGSYIYGAFTVPTLTKPQNCAISSGVAMWVGFDGSGAPGIANGNNDVLQAGLFGDPCLGDYYAFTEWWTDGCWAPYLWPCAPGSLFNVSPGKRDCGNRPVQHPVCQPRPVLRY
jgi:hypothetical protein